MSAPATNRSVGKSPWGQADQQGALNRITAETRASIIARMDGTRV